MMRNNITKLLQHVMNSLPQRPQPQPYRLLTSRITRTLSSQSEGGLDKKELTKKTQQEVKENELDNILMLSQRDMSFVRHLIAKSIAKAKRNFYCVTLEESEGDFLRLYPDGKDNLEFLKSPGLHVKVKFSVNPIVLSDVQEASSCLYKKIHLNYPCIKEDDDDQAKGVLYMDQFFKMCASMLCDGGTIRLICSKDMFERWTVKETAANNKFRLDHKYPLTDGYCPGFRPRKGFGVDPNEVLSTVDSVLCHFSKIPQIQTGQGQIGSKVATGGNTQGRGKVAHNISSSLEGRSSGDVSAAIAFISEEKLTVELARNGLGEFVVDGILKMEVKSKKHGFFKFQVESATPNIKFTTHNNIDIPQFSSDMILGLKSPNTPFPKKFRPLRWKLESKDVSLLPLRINCRPSVSGHGMNVRIEYNASNMFVLQNVVIAVPLPTLSEPLNVELVHGDWRYDAKESVLEWSMPLIDDSNPTGAMEFVVRQAVPVDASKEFFPVSVVFTSTTTFCNLKDLFGYFDGTWLFRL
ncbi:clathrin adaptor complexes medium subunit family protein [Artemisia annua]|uniref:Coatomer subunit delta n=1 Tax=Artemisia annua TaxID=35608 RepID=A0A2U1M2M1_ARTAN|nr:clathrin adaptor complexes medium subunit family protein [Artemisia annua]